MVSFITLIIVLAIVIFILYKYSSSIGMSGGAIPVSNVISHWSHFFKTFSVSSDAFYKDLEEVIKQHEMPHSTMKRVKHKEGGILSANREYLRIQHGDIVFDVCAAPFGKDFFISWWLYESESATRSLLKNTRVGDFLKARAAKRTFYQIDEEDMFRSCVHQCILDTVDTVGEVQGVRLLTDRDRVFDNKSM